MTPPTCSLRGVLCSRCWCSAFLVSSHASSVLTRGEGAWLTGSVSSDSPLNRPSSTRSWPLRGGKPRPERADDGAVNTQHHDPLLTAADKEDGVSFMCH